MARLTPTDIEAAIRVGCVAADVRLTCSYPDCACQELYPDSARIREHPLPTGSEAILLLP